jgi:hypothetical protein
MKVALNTITVSFVVDLMLWKGVILSFVPWPFVFVLTFPFFLTFPFCLDLSVLSWSFVFTNLNSNFTVYYFDQWKYTLRTLQASIFYRQQVALNTITVSFVVDLMLWKGKVFEILNKNNVKVLFFNAPNKFY